jgi:hypothetical protein
MCVTYQCFTKYELLSKKTLSYFHYYIFYSKGKLPFGDVSNDEARQKVLNGQKPIKPTKFSGEL